MSPETAIKVATVAFIPVIKTADFVSSTKSKVANKIDEIKCEQYNRKHFDKQTGYIRRSKRK